MPTELNRIFSYHICCLQIWDNELLTWDPKDYDGIQTVRLDASLVWIPDIVLYNRLALTSKKP